MKREVYQSESLVLALHDVQHILPMYEDLGEEGKELTGIRAITRHTRWDFEADCWGNDVFVAQPEATRVLAAFLRFHGADVHHGGTEETGSRQDEPDEQDQSGQSC